MHSFDSSTAGVFGVIVLEAVFVGWLWWRSRHDSAHSLVDDAIRLGVRRRF